LVRDQHVESMGDVGIALLFGSSLSLSIRLKREIL
jgi:hypothetical protein